MNRYCARFLLWVLKKIYRHKDEGLSYLIHGVADEYARKPERRWWSMNKYEGFGIDLCPICGEEIYITGRTKDGRLIGSCGDAFTDEQWNKGDELDNAQR